MHEIMARITNYYTIFAVVVDNDILDKPHHTLSLAKLWYTMRDGMTLYHKNHLEISYVSTYFHLIIYDIAYLFATKRYENDMEHRKCLSKYLLIRSCWIYFSI